MLPKAMCVRHCIEMPRVLSMMVNERAGGWRRRVSLTSRGIRHCPWEGCHGPEIATVALESWFERLRSCGSAELNLLLQSLTDGAWYAKESLVDIYESKLGMWRRRPYSFIGFCRGDLVAAKNCAKVALAEWAGRVWPRVGPQALCHELGVRFEFCPLCRGAQGGDRHRPVWHVVAGVGTERGRRLHAELGGRGCVGGEQHHRAGDAWGAGWARRGCSGIVQSRSGLIRIDISECRTAL